MKKITYLFKRIFKMNVKDMVRTAKDISSKNNRNFLIIFCDMIVCGFAYQAGYVDYRKYEFYLLNRKERKTFLTRGKNNQIIKTFNNHDHRYKFEDKAIFNELFNNFVGRNWMVINGSNLEEFISFMKINKKVILKLLDSDNAKGIGKLEYDEGANYEKIYAELLENKQLLVERWLTQHPDLDKLCDSSVNTMRMYTLYKDGTSYFVHAALKIGKGSIADNLALGGMYTCLDDSGVAYVEALDYDNNTYATHPITGEKIVGFQVPLFKEAVNMVKEAAKFVPQVGYVGWDVAISPNRPVIIEGNFFPEILQPKPSMLEKKEGLIPKYKRLNII